MNMLSSAGLRSDCIMWVDLCLLARLWSVKASSAGLMMLRVDVAVQATDSHGGAFRLIKE